MFIDEIKVYARAGHGGKGSVAFHREAFVPKGGHRVNVKAGPAAKN